MKTSIIIGTHNDENHVESTIRSVLEQSDTDWDCLLIDNGSDDRTIEIARSCVGLDPRFTLFEKANEGPGAGRNYGVRHITNDCAFIVFLDGDDCLHPEFIRTLKNYLVEHPEVGLVACQFEVINDQGEIIRHGHRSRYKRGLLGIPRPLFWFERRTPFMSLFAATGQGPFAMFRRDVFDRTTGYEEGMWYHEDTDIFCQMALIAEVHSLPGRLYFKRVHGNNLLSGPHFDYGKFRDKWDFYFSGRSNTDNIIDDAFRYYHGYHAPFRRFRIALKSCFHFCLRPNRSKLQWAGECLKIGLIDLFTKRSLRIRFEEREQARLRAITPLEELQ